MKVLGKVRFNPCISPETYSCNADIQKDGVNVHVTVDKPLNGRAAAPEIATIVKRI